jgi:hypothetical protein
VPGQASDTPTTGQPAAAADDVALTAQLRSQNSSQNISNAHLRTLQPLGTQLAASATPANNSLQTTAPAMTAAPDPAILSLANNDDLNVSTLAREAYKAKHGEEPPQDEVVISLR